MITVHYPVYEHAFWTHYLYRVDEELVARLRAEREREEAGPRLLRGAGQLPQIGHGAGPGAGGISQKLVARLRAEREREEAGNPVQFSDVEEGDYFYAPVQWAAANGVSSGMGDGVYSGYWGLDAQGKAACLTVVFINSPYICFSPDSPRPIFQKISGFPLIASRPQNRQALCPRQRR